MLDRRVLLLALGPSLMADPAWAADQDHERARRAFQRGEIRSLSEIMAQLRPELGGEVIEVELENRKGVYVYKFKILPSNGRLWEVYVDARTGKITRREQD